MTRIITYNPPEGVTVNDRYTVKLRPAEGGEWVQVKCFNVLVDMHDIRSASMAYFDFDGEVEVEVSVDIKCFWIYKAAIRPLSRGIPFEFNENKIRFRLSKPENLSIELNGDRFHNLHLFAGSVETRDTVIDTATSITVSNYFNGAQLKEQLEAMPAGRTLVFTKGFHKVEDTSLYIPSGTRVVFRDGAVLNGTLVCDGAEDVDIRGRGVVWQTDIGRVPNGKSGLEIRFSNSISIDGIIFVNPPYYTVTVGASSQISISNIKAFSCYGWCDGIDMMSSRGVTVDGCFLRMSDDCISIYGERWDYRGDTADITVKNCALWADVAHPVNIGTHGDHKNNGNILEQLVFLNIDILEHHEMQPGYLGCMAINAGDKNTVRDVLFKDIRIEPFERGKLIDLQVRFNPDYNPAPGNCIERVRFENIHYTGTGEEPSLIEGYDGARPVRDITVNGLYMNGKRAVTADDCNLRIGKYTENIVIS